MSLMKLSEVQTLEGSQHLDPADATNAAPFCSLSFVADQMISMSASL
jgi:hypothetical protein